MSEGLDLPSLEAVNAWAEGVLQREERRKQFQELHKGFMDSIKSLHSDLVPIMLAEPEANMRKSVLALEKSTLETVAKQHEAIAKLEAMLTQAKNRTRSLERWLEAVS